MKKPNEILYKPNSKKRTLIVYLLSMYVLPIATILLIELVFTIIEATKKVEPNDIAFNVTDLISKSTLYVIFFSYMIITFYIYITYIDIYKISFTKMKKNFMLQKTLTMSALVVIINYTTGTILNIFGVTIPQNQSIIDGYIVSNIIITLITFVLFAPFVEEIIYRYIIQNWAKKYGVVVSIFLSSLIFSLVHCNWSNPFSIIQYLVLGICFAIIYEKTRNIAVVLTTHSLNNLIILIFRLL